MNLVDKYLEEAVFPFHKILNWHFEQRIERERDSVYTFGNPNPLSFGLGSRTTRQAHITLVGITEKEYRYIQNRRVIKNLTLRHEDATLYIREGAVVSFGQEDLGIIPDSSTVFELVLDCVEVAINASPPVSGSERIIRLGDRTHKFRSDIREEFRREYMVDFASPTRTVEPPTSYNRETERLRDSLGVNESAFRGSYDR
ncbi:hypothetical protein P8918_13235 [Bacillus spizizenii]|nr:hypothetical protein [Bacillus spizizenii]MCY8890532.1 hypothetical protein [Bacillus spizizenii]MEC0841990.1 hypothetical protein [Bacillus spizizenii]